MIIALDEVKRRVSLSTKVLENHPGEVLENMETVMSEAADRADKARTAILKGEASGGGGSSKKSANADTSNKRESAEKADGDGGDASSDSAVSTEANTSTQESPKQEASPTPDNSAPAPEAKLNDSATDEGEGRELEADGAKEDGVPESTPAES